MKHYLINGDRVLIASEEQVAQQGFVQKPDYPEGFLTKNDGSHDYAETIKQVVVTWTSVDSYGKISRKTFSGKNCMEKARAFRKEEWPEFGGVATDGISRFCGFLYRC